uniref:Flippase n=1 Tax=candidate division WOR-3 bacterium TaxID=2052148 RepID=A0A7C2PA60_UNCW3
MDGKKNFIELRGQLLIKNTILNFIGLVTPLFVGMITIPFIVQGLGTDRFGLLSLAWVVFVYFSIFDLGLTRATTKFVAEAFGKGETDQVPRLVWTAVTIQGVLGITGAIVLAKITPLLVEQILKVPLELLGEAKATFRVLALAVPVVLISGSFRGVLEASQRFDLVNAVSVPTSVLSYVLPLVGLFFGMNLQGIVTLILLGRIGTLIAFVALNLYTTPQLKRLSGSFSLLRLFSFGGWVTVSSIVGPVLVYLDRFLIGSLFSMAAVAYYSAPYEIITRLWIIPVSFTMTLFPAFSSLEGIKETQKLVNFFTRSFKYILLALGPIILAITLFAKEVLQIWLGIDFAKESSVVLQILAVGVLVNSLAQIPFALLQGTGRPDLPAKFHLLELPMYLGIAWFLINKWGITGAAVAWTLRVILDAFLLFGATLKVLNLSIKIFIHSNTTVVFFTLLLFSVIICVVKLMDIFSLFVRLVLFVCVFGLFFCFVWKKVLDDLDRSAIFKALKLW